MLTTNRLFPSLMKLSFESLDEQPMSVSGKIVKWLQEHQFLIDVYLHTPGYQLPEQAFILSVFKKIQGIVNDARYAITQFGPLEGDRHFPQLDILTETEDNNAFIRCELPPNKPDVSSIDEANRLVCALSRLNLPWDALSECDGRAEIVCRLLKAMNIREEKIRKVWIAHKNGDFQFFSSPHQVVSWQWHIAPLIITQSGKKLVIDPFFNKVRALEPIQWAQLIAKGEEHYDIGEIECRYTCEMLKRKQVLVTDELFQKLAKRVYAYHFLSKVMPGSYTETILTTCILPSSSHLISESKGVDLRHYCFVGNELESDSVSCTIS